MTAKLVVEEKLTEARAAHVRDLFFVFLLILTEIILD
jgi:hypothetical protein